MESWNEDGMLFSLFMFGVGNTIRVLFILSFLSGIVLFFVL
jgi:hypothetical protein